MNIALFKRPYTSSFNEAKIKHLLKDRLNLNTILKWTAKKTRNNFIFGLEQDYLAYRFEILSNWIKRFERYDEWYTLSLNNIVSALLLQNQLKAQELAYINHVNSIEFAKKRNVKKLIVDFNIHKDEVALFSADNVTFYQINIHNNQKILIGKNFKLHLTNRAIVIHNQLFEYRIDFKDSLSFKLSKHGIKWFCKRMDFEFQCQDIYVLYEYLKIIIFKYLPNELKPFSWRKGYLERD